MSVMHLWSPLPWLAVLIALAAFAGCRAGVGAPDAAASSPDGVVELTERPEVLLDPDFPLDRLALRGVRLGDPRTAIRSSTITSPEDKDGWIITRGGARFRVIGGEVVTLGLWDDRALARLGIETEADIERVFGKAEEIAELATITAKLGVYRFSGGARRVSWDRISNKLLVVNVGKPLAAPPATAPAP